MIAMTCSRCPSSIITASAAEAVKWSVEHDKICPAPDKAADRA